MDRSARAVQDVTDVAVSALSADSPAEGMRAVTETLRVLIGADNVLFHVFERGGWSAIHGVAPASAWGSMPLHGAPTAELSALHPAVAHVTRHEVPEPFALTDLVSERQWRSTQMAGLLRPVWGRSLKLHLPAGSADGYVRGWAATRDGHDYTRNELERVSAVQPVLDVVVRHYVAASGARLCGGAAGLTAREVVVLKELSKGVTTEGVGRRLGISGRTVSKHLERGYRKLGAHDRVTALRRASELGLLTCAPSHQVGRSPAGPAF
jgi:DNA-binding CsgD family transcriptional regulator